MKFLKFDVPKLKMDALPEDELIFFIQLGNVLNELNILQKCIIFSSTGIQDLKDIERSGQVCQALFFIKMLAGKLFEGKRLLESPVLRSHKDKLSVDGQKCLKELNRYFSKSNNIDCIRNKFAFHYDSGVIKTEFSKRSPDESFDLFLSCEMGNCLYSFSDVIVNFAILNKINPSCNQQAMDSLMKEIVIDVVEWFQKVGGECVAIIAHKVALGHPKRIEIKDRLSIDNIRVPYFVKRPKEK